jgi:2-polyprenyl-3-methyl-5-hydroxy-6-metoxy-1,4-benzoquinol methylase
MLRPLNGAKNRLRGRLHSLRSVFGGRQPIKAANHTDRSFPLDLPELCIELSATPEQQAKMLARIEAKWMRFGETDPHYSVMANSQFRAARIAGSIERFWASGDGDAKIAASVLSRLGFGDLSQRTCTEYGCGIGRVTIPLAVRFANVVSYDISQSHLALARQRADAAGVDNISFHHCAGGIPDCLEDCDFFYSRLVFQHNPPPVIRKLICLALASLRPGGMAMFGVPIYFANYRFQIDEYLASASESSEMEMHCIPQREVFSLVAAAGCSLIEVREEPRYKNGIGNTFLVGRPIS